MLVLIDTSASMNGPVPGTGKTKIQLLHQAEPALLAGFTGTDQADQNDTGGKTVLAGSPARPERSGCCD